MKKNILFVETATPTIYNKEGGSLISLYLLIQVIDKHKYNIYINLFEKFAIIEKYKAITPNVLVTKRFDFFKRLSKKKHNTYKIGKFFKHLIIIDLLITIVHFLYIIYKYKIDIVHTNDRVSTNIEAIIAAYILRKKCIVHQRQFNYSLPSIFSRILRYPHKFIAISEDIKNNLLKDIKIPPYKVVVLNNWVNLKEYSQYNFTKELGDVVKILWIGRIVEWKGLHLLIKLAELLLKKNVNFYFHIYGDTHSGDNYLCGIQKDINSKKIKDYFTFYTYSSIGNIFQEYYDCLIHTSIKPEPFGRVIIECMAAGIPVFASNRGAPLEILNDGINGFIYDPEKLDVLVEKLLKFLSSHDQRIRVIQNAKQDVVVKYSGKEQKLIIKEIYDEL